MNGVAKAIIDGIFGLLKQWWFWLMVVVIGGLLLGILDVGLISTLADKAVEIIRALKGN